MKHLLTVVFLIAGGIFLSLLFFDAPLTKPHEDVVSIQRGLSVSDAAHLLKKNGSIRFEPVFSALVTLFGGKSGVIAGVYAVSERENVVSLARRFSKGTTALKTLKITIPEGVTNAQIADILEKSLIAFDSEKFKILARPYEGYLFPDTYSFLPSATPEEVIAVMRNTFNEKTASLKTRVDNFGRPFAEVVTMASILEKEARQSETRRVVAGILWKRMSIGMPLQVDAVFGYILEKNGYAPTLDDLKIKSPYNTYLNRGLPPTPIGNPGFGAIEDALTPTKTPYLYYLTDKEGNIYYAKTFTEHVNNKQKLR